MEPDPEDYTIRREFQRAVPHYYGTQVRQLFLAAGIIIFISLPFFRELLPFNIFIILSGVILLIYFAAFTNPQLWWTAVANTAISAFGSVLFEYFAVSQYNSDELMLFIIRQMLAIIFLFAFYFAAKTARAMYLKRKRQQHGGAA